MRAGLLSPIKILVYLPPLTVMLPSWKPVKEVHREIRRSYEEHLGAVKALLESSDTGGGLGRIGIGGIPPTLEGHDGMLDDPFQGELAKVTAYLDLSAPGSPE